MVSEREVAQHVAERLARGDDAQDIADGLVERGVERQAANDLVAWVMAEVERARERAEAEEAREALWIGAAMVALGVAVSVGSYLFLEGGYIVAVGLIGFGLFRVLRGLGSI